MSDTILNFIPTDPGFVPGKSGQNDARVFLNGIFKNSNIELIETGEVNFIDQGAFFESVSCNLCGKMMDIELWQQAMDSAYQSRFEQLTFTTPCCHETTSLNNLNYDQPAGFSKFTISIGGPPHDLKSNEISELEKILGTKVRKIWAHY
jgi:hypothetical protein